MLRSSILGTVLAILAPVSANAVIIDLFSNPYGAGRGPTELTISPGSPNDKMSIYDPIATADPLYLGGIIGDRRIHELVKADGPDAPVVDTSTSVISFLGPFPGLLAHNQSSRTVTRTVLTYNNLGANGRLLDGNGFLLEVAYADHAARWSLEVKDNSNDVAKVFFGTGTPGLEDLIDGFVFIPFSAFINGTGCAADLACDAMPDADITFSNITSIQFVANAGVGRRSFNTELGSITTVTVPEPASLTLLGAGLAGIGLLARRRRKPL